jgi:hypothetical protein
MLLDRAHLCRKPQYIGGDPDRGIDKTQSIGFQLSFRTLGDFGTSSGLSERNSSPV